jgi:hypothetical protein
MDGVTSKVPQKISVLLQNYDFDSSPSQQIAQHHSGRTATRNATATPQFLR